jgi:hypothetical protein
MAHRPSTKTVKTMLDLPWWAGGASAAVVYAALAYVLPAFGAADPALRGTSLVLQTAAPWAASALLLFAAVAYLDGLRQRHRFDPYSSIDGVRNLSRPDFERALTESFCLQGYTVEDGARSAGGVTLLLRKPDRNILVQCSHGSDAQVGVEAVRQLHEAMVAESATGGLILTSAAFTSDARACAAEKPIGLIEGRALLELVNRGRTLNPKASKPMVRREPHLGMAMSELPECPLCGNPMVRTPEKGSEPEIELWGCSLPRCAGSRAR